MIAIKFYCEHHLAGHTAIDAMYKGCATCMKQKTAIDCQGGEAECWNLVCPHTDSYAAGDYRCVPCQGAKRIKIV
jgi:hypothetical protein